MEAVRRHFFEVLNEIRELHGAQAIELEYYRDALEVIAGGHSDPKGYAKSVLDYPSYYRAPK